MILREALIKLGVAPDAGAARRAVGFANGIRGAMARAQESADSMRQSVVGMAAQFVGFAAVVAGGRALVAFNSEMDVLQVSLDLLTGSAERGAAAMAMLEDLTLRTPFQVNNLANAFAILQNAGLDPTAESLTHFGDAAVIARQGLEETAEAVADAVTFQFERLRALGITTRTEGNNIDFTFRGVTTRVRKESRAIYGYLDTLATQNFGGAMALQMETLPGAISNARSAMLFFLRTVGRSGVNEALQRLANQVGGLIEGNKGFARTLGEFLARAIDKAGAALAWLTEHGELVRGVLITLGGSLVLGKIARFGAALFAVVTKLFTPFGMFRALLMLIPLLIDDLYAFIQGRPSAIGELLGDDAEAARQWVIDFLAQAREHIPLIIGMFGEMLTNAINMGISIVQAFDDVGTAIGEGLGAAWVAVSEFFASLKPDWEAFTDFLADGIEGTVNGVGALWNGAKSIYQDIVDWITDAIGTVVDTTDAFIDTLNSLPVVGGFLPDAAGAMSGQLQADIAAQRAGVSVPLSSAEIADRHRRAAPGNTIAVAPDQRGRGRGAVVQNVTINVSTPNPSQAAAETARRIDRSGRELDRDTTP